MLRKRLQQRQSQDHDATPLQGQQRQGQRRRTGPETAVLPIPLPVTPTAAECAALLKTLVKHLLFQRAQIPFLYDELLRAAHERQRAAEAEGELGAGSGSRRRRVPKEERRLFQFLAKTEEALAGIDAALQACGVPPRCFLLLGSSTSKPREAYEVVMPADAVGQLLQPPQPTQHGEACAHAAAGGEAVEGAAGGAHAASGAQQQGQPAGRPRASRQERLCQLTLRQLVVGGAELPEGTADTVACKLFILMEGSSSSPSPESGVASPAGQRMLPAGEAADGPAAPRGFAVKRQFRLSMRKGVHYTVLLGHRPGEDPPAGGQAAQQHAAAAAGAAGPDADHNASDAMDCSATQGGAEAETMDLSQLPDAEPLQAAAGQLPEVPAVGAAAQSVWYLCKTVVKGLNSGTPKDGAS